MNPKIDFTRCTIVASSTNDKEQTQLLEMGGKYFYRLTQGGKEKDCFEISLFSQPFDGVKVFSFSLDGLHEINIDSRIPEKRLHTVQRIKPENLVPGMRCKNEQYGVDIEFLDENAVKINGKKVKVQADFDFTYKLRKTKIYAIDGARGFYSFVERIIFEKEYTGAPALHETLLEKIKELYQK